MKLYDFLQTHKYACEDTADTIFDATVTIDWDEEDFRNETDDPYYKFCETIYKLVDLKEVNRGEVWIVDWSGFAQKYRKQLTEFLECYYSNPYLAWDEEDEDDFCYDCINMIHNWISGGLSNPQYTKFIEIFENVVEDGVPLFKSITSLVNKTGILLDKLGDAYSEEQKEVREAVGKLAEEFINIGKDELAEYCLAQTNMCTTFVPM
jgi:hypothetical protein